MAHTLQTVLGLVGFIWILIPGTYLKKEAGTCQDLFGTESYLNFSNSLKLFINCSNHVTESLEAEQRSELFKLLQTAADKLRSIRIKACQNVNPKNCSFPIIPANGGLICVTLNKTRYCKPMCNKGYDFQFLRRSRAYESCGEATEYTWTSQYVKGSRLAVCAVSSTQVSAEPSHYFPKRCQDVQYDYSQETRMISTFQKELKEKVHGKVNDKTMCLLCGD